MQQRPKHIIWPKNSSLSIQDNVSFRPSNRPLAFAIRSTRLQTFAALARFWVGSVVLPAFGGHLD